MSAQAQVQVDGQVSSVSMSPTVSSKGTQGYRGQCKLVMPDGGKYQVQVTAWLCGSGNGGSK